MLWVGGYHLSYLHFVACVCSVCDFNLRWVLIIHRLIVLTNIFL